MRRSSRAHRNGFEWSKGHFVDARDGVEDIGEWSIAGSFVVLRARSLL